MASVLKNNAATTLANPVTELATSIDVVSAASLPTLAEGEWFPLTLIRANTQPEQFEIVHVTGISGNTLTVDREQEGTAPLTFQGGDLAEVRLTVDALLAMKASGMNVEIDEGGFTIAAALNSKVTKGQVGSEVVPSATGDITFSEALNKRVLTCVSVESISSLSPSNNQQISLYSYHSGKGYGGGFFIFDSVRPKGDHNGGTVISPTVPWEWSDLGEGYISGAGETDPSGTGCWIRQDNGAPSPLAFGAISETGVDSWPSIHASLDNYFKQSLNFYTYFGGGRFLFTSKEYRRTSGLFRKQIHHLHIEALDNFEGDAVLALTPAAPNVLNDVRINHSTIKGGPGQNAVSYVDYLILLDQTQGVWLEDCELNIAGLACIRDLKDGPGCEVHINDCRISSAAQNNPGAAGVDFAGNDSVIHGGVIRECDPLIRLRKGANSVQHVHLYNFAADKNAWGIEAQDAAMLEIKNNYIDDVRVLLVNPRNMQLTNNKGVVGSSLNWTSGPAAFVLIQAGEANFVMHDYLQTDNNFRCRSAENPVSNIARRATGNTFDAAAMRNVIVKDNVGENCVIRTTHPKVAHEFSNATSSNIDLSVFSIFGPTLSNIYKRAGSYAYNGTDFASFRVGIAGSVATVYADSAISGTVIATYDCNAL